jgi:hypothetical protein
MPTKVLPPDDRRRISDLERRVAILERAVTSTGAGSVDELVFSYAGTLTAGTESPPKVVRVSAVLASLAVAFGTAGTTDTTLEVKKNGAVKNTLTVPASTTLAVLQVAVAFSAADKISLRVNTAGTGAADMTATARFT